jgi:pimeloyl-ACP methyl ester carboxylesterase
MRDEMKPGYLADGPGRSAVLDLCMEMAEALGAEVFARQSRALTTRPDRRAALRDVRVPTLVLCGREDRLCPLHRHETIAGLVPGAVLEVIDGAGHLPTLERPETVSVAWAGWLARVDAAEAGARSARA